jgi:hypothetical protein
VSAQPQECGVEVDPGLLGEHPLGLLDDYTAAERAL